MPDRTDEEWHELYRRLRAIADDPEEEKARRIRALAIIETIPRGFRDSEPEQQDIDYDMDYNGGTN